MTTHLDAHSRWQALAALCLLLALPVHAEATGDELFHFQANVYPEWLYSNFGTPSASGTDVGTMGTLRNDRTTLSSNATFKTSTSDHAWSNSYVGLRGVQRIDEVAYGYDFQVVMDLQKDMLRQADTRDFFLYAETDKLGRLSYGKMDSIYKEFGDRVRILGVSPSNVSSTSLVQSGVGWKAKGGTSFYNRRNKMLTWYSPNVDGFEAGVSHSWDDAGNVGPDPTLSAVALRWSHPNYYASFQIEEHRNWLPVSYNNTSAASTTIVNLPFSTKSRDTGYRVSLGWNIDRLRLGTDIAALEYTESTDVATAGRFRKYQNMTWQVSAEYAWDAQLKLAANYAQGAAGSCELSGNVACSTNGLGGDQTTLGASYRVLPHASFFGLVVRMRNNPASYYGSSAQGADVNSLALGIRIDYP